MTVGNLEKIMEPLKSAEIPCVVFEDCLHVTQDNNATILLTMVTSDLLELFVRHQLQAVQEEIFRLNPNAFNDPVQYYQISKDYRLLWRVWTDFLALIERKRKEKADQQELSL